MLHLFTQFFKLIIKQKIILNFFLIIFAFFFIELIARIVLFFPTNINVFKFGFDKKIIIEMIDLSKLQINISNRIASKIKSDSNINFNKNNINIWTFGGSTTYGDNCPNASSWVNELERKNKKIQINNFAFNGADSDQLAAILNINLEKKETPEMILWASKFNMNNILTKLNYRNKKILNHDFQDTKKNKLFLSIKRIDKTLKSYFISYNLLDGIIIRLIPNKNIYKKKSISDKDIEMMVKNFEINTTEAIEISRSKGVREFYLISLFSGEDFSNNSKRYEFNLYDSFLNKIRNKYPDYVKIIDLTYNLPAKKKEIFLCDRVHQKLEGNIYQATQINNFLLNNSNFFK